MFVVKNATIVLSGIDVTLSRVDPQSGRPPQLRVQREGGTAYYNVSSHADCSQTALQILRDCDCDISPEVTECLSDLIAQVVVV